MASVVSALSGFVANNHQTMLSFPPPSSKIPYGGFSPVRLQTGVRDGHLHACAFIGRHCGSSPDKAFCSVVGLRQAAPRPSDHAASPVALGSPTGYSVRPAHRLLWPHPRLCVSAWAYVLFPGVLRLRASPIYSTCLSDRVALLTPSAFRVPLTASSQEVMPSPSSERLGAE